MPGNRTNYYFLPLNTLSTEALFSRRCLQRLLIKKRLHCSTNIHSKSRILHLTFSVAKIITFKLFLDCKQSFPRCENSRLYSCYLSLLCLLPAHCISINTIAVSLICIWTGGIFWSVAPLLGWGSYTGLFYASDLTVLHATWQQSRDLILYLVFLRSRLWNLWSGLVQSQLLHYLQVLHHIHPDLLLFHPGDDHALLLHLHYQHSENH